MKKQPHQSLAEFYQQFQAHVHLCEEMNVQLYEPALATSIMKERGGATVTNEDRKKAQERSVAMRFICASGYTDYLTHLRNCYLDSKDVYPKTIADAFTIMDQRTPQKTQTSEHNNTGANAQTTNNTTPSQSTGVAFPTTVSGNSSNTSIVTTPTVTTSTNTPVATSNEQSGEHLQTSSTMSACALTCHAFISQDIPTSHPPDSWILLDNQSTVHVFGNKTLLKNIHCVKDPLQVHGITGTKMVKQQGEYDGVTVWYDAQIPVNIMSLAKLKHVYDISYNSQGGQFIITEPGTRHIKYIFQESPDGLHYYDTKVKQVYISTVTENKNNIANTTNNKPTMYVFCKRR